MLETLRKEHIITCDVKDRVTYRFMIGEIFLVNSNLLIWYTVRQKTVETSDYSSKLVAARIGAEMVSKVKYKFRMPKMDLEKWSLVSYNTIAI